MTKHRGSLAVETVVLTPVLVLLLVFITYAGRVVIAQHELDRFADIAARAASQARLSSMVKRGVDTAHMSMKENDTHCLNFLAHVRRKSIGGVEQVEVRTQCRVNIVGLSLLGIRSPLLNASSSEVIDVYRHP